MDLFAAENGTPAEPVVVLLHGFGASHAAWETVSQRLSPTARVLAYDLPGHGVSLVHPDAGPAKRAARAILADLAARNIVRAHVVGHSMGGAIATLMALAEPARVASLVLAAPGGFGDTINGPLLERYAAAADEAAVRASLASMSAPGHQPSPAAIEASLRLRAIPGQIGKLGDVLGFIVRDGRQGTIPREALRDLATPVTVLWGMQDPVLPVRQADGLPARFNVRLIPSAGHMLIEEAPDEVVDAALAALAQPSRSPSD